MAEPKLTNLGVYRPVMQNIRIPIATTHAWLAFAGWIQSAAK
jgi:hypothetical protein